MERILIFWKSLGVKIKKLKHPKAVLALEMDHSFIPEEAAMTGLLFIVLYLGVVFLSTLTLAGMGVDLLSAFSGSAASMGNVGPGSGTLGSMASLPAAWRYSV